MNETGVGPFIGGVVVGFLATVYFICPIAFRVGVTDTIQKFKPCTITNKFEIFETTINEKQKFFICKDLKWSEIEP